MLTKQFMAAKVNNVKDYEAKTGGSYFFDNNIWMLLFAGIAGAHMDKQRKYSRLLQDIRNRDGIIFISSLILSEYINRSLRLYYEQWIVSNNKIRAVTDYKRDYRGSEDYKTALKSVISEVEDILSISERRPDDFNSIDINTVLKDMSTDSDFNDSYYVELCDKNKMILVTDDKDLVNTSKNINIVTYQ